MFFIASTCAIQYSVYLLTILNSSTFHNFFHYYGLYKTIFLYQICDAGSMSNSFNETELALTTSAMLDEEAASEQHQPGKESSEDKKDPQGQPQGRDAIPVVDLTQDSAPLAAPRANTKGGGAILYPKKKTIIVNRSRSGRSLSPLRDKLPGLSIERVGVDKPAVPVPVPSAAPSLSIEPLARTQLASSSSKAPPSQALPSKPKKKNTIIVHRHSRSLPSKPVVPASKVEGALGNKPIVKGPLEGKTRASGTSPLITEPAVKKKPLGTKEELPGIKKLAKKAETQPTPPGGPPSEGKEIYLHK